MKKINIGVICIGESSLKALTAIANLTVNNDEMSISYFSICCNDKSIANLKNLSFACLTAECFIEQIAKTKLLFDLVIICFDLFSEIDLKCAATITKELKKRNTVVCCITSYGEAKNMCMNEQIQEIAFYSDSIIYARSRLGETCDNVLKDVLSMIVGQMDNNSIIMYSPEDMVNFMKDSGEAHYVSVASDKSKGDRNNNDIVSQIINKMPSGVSIDNANKVMVRVIFSADIDYSEIDEFISDVVGIINEEAEIIVGAFIDDRLEEAAVSISIIASNFFLTKSNN